MAIRSVNPATEEVLAEFTALSAAELEKKLLQSNAAYFTWKENSFEVRAEHFRNIAAELRASMDESAKLLTLEMGKTFEQAKAEIEKSAWNFEHYADKGAEYLAPRHIKTEATESYVRFDPLGVILTVMPWNYPFWQVLRMVAPILMAGNTVVLKHASNVPQSALKIEAVLRQAGLPEGVFQTLLIDSAQVESVIQNDFVKGVSLTGSEMAGQLVGTQAGREIKPVVLELGGSDPSIILDDADLELTCKTVATSRLQNNGQSCIGSKRFIVHEAIYDEFLSRIKAIFESYVIGDPMDPNTMIGPVASESALNELLEQIDSSVKAGATIETGGKRHGSKGYYLEPTILTNVTAEVPSYHEELFGPVASIIKVKDDQEAVTVANATRFGLGASIYTKDIERAKKLIPQIEAGNVFINQLVKSDPRLPFGGTKKSGLGRELSEEGIKAFTNIKSVLIA